MKHHKRVSGLSIYKLFTFKQIRKFPKTEGLLLDFKIFENWCVAAEYDKNITVMTKESYYFVTIIFTST